jgi:hypothetical protein
MVGLVRLRGRGLALGLGRWLGTWFWLGCKPCQEPRAGSIFRFFCRWGFPQGAAQALVLGQCPHENNPVAGFGMDQLGLELHREWAP